MYLNKKELTIFFNGANDWQKQVLAYARTHHLKVNFQDISKIKFSTNTLSYLLDKLGDDVKVLINKSTDFYKEHLKGHKFSLRDWGNILRNNPELLQYPVAIYEDQIEIIIHPSAIALFNQYKTIDRV